MKIHSSKKPLTKAAGIIVALLLLLGGAEVWYQVRVGSLKAVADRVDKSIIKPMGGVEESSEVNGAHVWNICVDNGPCPMETRSWYVLVDPDSENKLKGQMLKEYESLEKDKNKFAINLNITATYELSQQNPPYTAPAGKEWASVVLYVYEQ